MLAEVEGIKTIQVERTSDVLKKMVVETDDANISIGEICSKLGGRSFGILMLFFAIPGAIPSLPSVTSIFAIPIIVFAVQLIMGYPRPYLPKYFLDMTFSRTTFNTIINKSNKYLVSFEKLCKPRIFWLTDKKYEKLHGMLILILAIIFLIPLPFMNWPPSFAICLIALALIERDGILMILGLVASVVAMVIAVGMLSAIAALVMKLFSFVGL